MLRNMVQEIVRRRLWPIPLIALLVIIAAPVLLMKPAPSGAPAATAQAPAPAAVGKLPARAQRLLDATAARARRATGSERDPFQAPSGHRASAAPTATPAASAGAKAKTATPAATSSGAGAAAPTKPIPVVIQNPDGTSATTNTSATTPSTGAGSGAAAGSTGPASVDVRFGPSAGGRVHRAIPRLQTFYIHGKLAAVFVKYSPSRNKAVFAVSPDLVVSGPVKCRTLNGVCRYVDIPAGSYARLTMLTADRILVTRRLDVARINRGASASSTTAVAAGDHSENACLLAKLQALRPGGTPIDRVACER